ncbi:MAG: cation:proton antiporter [archaeon]
MGPTGLLTATIEIADPIVMITLLLMVAKIFGYMATRVNQPKILGEIMAGVLLGPSIMNIIAPNQLLETLGELGIFFFMFLIGFRINLKQFIQLGKHAIGVAIAGIIIPLCLGAWLASSIGMHPIVALLFGISLSVTAVAVSADILVEFNMLEKFAGRMILEAGVFSDIIGLFALSFLIAVAQAGEAIGGSIFSGFLLLVAKIVGFFVILTIVGVVAVPRLVDTFENSRTGFFSFVTIFILLLAILSRISGLSGIIGTFLGGMIIRYALLRHKEVVGHQIYEEFEALSLGLLTPLFFIWVGVLVNISVLSTAPVLFILVLAIAVVGKIAGCGIAVKAMKRDWKDALTVGIGMNGRGEVELVVASLCRRLGFFDETIFSIVVLMALATTFMTPILLEIVLKKHPEAIPAIEPV